MFRKIKLSTVLAMCAMAIVLTQCSKKKAPDGAEGTAGGGFDESAANPEAGGEGGQASDLAAQAASNLKTVFFNYDAYILTAAGRSTLQANSAWLKENPSVIIQIEGHCDERGSIEYNLALGEKRANSVKNYLQKLGIDGSRLSIISLGEERPADPASNEAAWAKNRRTEFVVLSQ